MEQDAIAAVIEPHALNKQVYLVSLKNDTDLLCLFVRCDDYEIFKDHNAWRVVKANLLSYWEETTEKRFTKILNGDEIKSIKRIRAGKSIKRKMHKQE